MHSEDNHSLGDKLAFEACVPLACHPVSDESGLPQDTVLQETNEKCLRVILALNEYPAEPADEHSGVEFKLNLLLELTGELVARQLSLPRAVPVRLRADGVEWTSDVSPPASGGLVIVELYLHPQYPRALRLPGRLQETARHGAEYLCRVELLSLPETVRDLLEKFIFAHHRRTIAYTRHHQND